MTILLLCTHHMWRCRVAKPGSSCHSCDMLSGPARPVDHLTPVLCEGPAIVTKLVSRLEISCSLTDMNNNSKRVLDTGNPHGLLDTGSPHGLLD